MGRELSQPSRCRSKVTKEAEMKKLALFVPLVLALVLAAFSSGCSESSVAGGTAGGGEFAEGSAEAGGGGGSKASDRRLVTSPGHRYAVPQVGPQIIQTASVRLSIAHGSFDDKVDEAHAIVDSYGGFVVNSSASQG